MNMKMKEALERKIDLLQGSCRKLCQAHHLLKQVAVATENRAAKLKSQLGSSVSQRDI